MDEKRLENLIMDLMAKSHASARKEISPILYEVKNKILAIEQQNIKMEQRHELHIQQTIERGNAILERLNKQNGLLAKHDNMIVDINKKAVRYELTTRIVFTLIGVILVAVAGAITSLIIK